MSKKNKKTSDPFGATPTTNPTIEIGPQKKKPSPSVHAHDAFEVEIELEKDITEIQTRPPAEPITEEAPLRSVVPIRKKDEVGVELPNTSEEEILPFFMSSKETPMPMPSGASREEAKPMDDEATHPRMAQDLLELFDEPEDKAEEEKPRDQFWPDIKTDPAKKRFRHKTQQQKTPGSTGPSSEDPKQPSSKAGLGEIKGIEPLDISEFEPHKVPRKREKESIWPASTSGHAPMARSKKMVRRRFQINLRDVVLLLLVLVLAAAVYVAWLIYQDYRERTELEHLQQVQSMFEESRDSAIEKKAPAKKKKF